MDNIIAGIRGRLFKLKCRLLNKNISIGRDLRLFCPLSIKGEGEIKLGNNCTIRNIPGSLVHKVTLWTNSSAAKIMIGNSVQLTATRISCRFSIAIGDNTIIEDTSILDTDFHTLDSTRAIPTNESIKNCAIEIGENVGISSRTIITKGSKLGNNCLVAPNSLIKGSFPDNSVLIGNPAKIITQEN